MTDDPSDPTQPDPKRPVTGEEVLAAGLADWRLLLRALHARFRTGDLATGLRFAAQIGEAADAVNHHPDLDLRYGHVEVRLLSHDVFALTSRDLALAATISGIAAEMGLAADPAALRLPDLALDTADAAEITPFWAAVLGLEPTTQGDEIADPGGTLPGMWFQRTDPHEEPRQRFHLDVFVPHDVVEQRLDEALAAGGRLVDDSEAPSFWVLADAQGNKACLCTWQPAAGS
jgi:4a-hydroxytetrahydrobiopterin dehydratase